MRNRNILSAIRGLHGRGVLVTERGNAIPAVTYSVEDEPHLVAYSGVAIDGDRRSRVVVMIA